MGKQGLKKKLVSPLGPINAKQKHQASGSTQKAKKKSKSKAPVKKSDDLQVNKKKNPFANAPIYDLLHSFERAPDQWAARYIIVLSGIILRAAVGLGSFSGRGQQPINGDFEAQRHWMEITTHLPVKEWYFYDLQYWGLDYPPLTAYHSWIIGKIGKLINFAWFEFETSRGIESDGIKTFMRFSSLLSELLIYFPPTFQFISMMGKKMNLSRMDQIVIAFIILSQPGLILIDHGHFQFNSVMLGLFLFSLIDLIKGNLVLASIWFMGSILFKQMSLYYAPFIFFYILSKLFTNKYSNKKTKKFEKLLKTLKSFHFIDLILLSLTIFITVVVILSPFILAPIFNNEISIIPTLVRQILIRMFPFQRGLFEDKVANFWCTSNLVIKYNTVFNPDQLQKLSLLLTVLAILPPCLMIFFKNITKFNNPPQLIIYGFSAAAWGFYLFSFQVHEKTVLVPLIPTSLLFVLNDHDTISVIQWINNIATFSLYPLLKKDELTLQYGVLLVLINWLIGGFTFKLSDNLLWPRNKNILWKLVILGSYLSVISFHIIDGLFLPPARYPDLWVILNTTISFGCFGLFYLWLLYKIYYL